MTAAAGSHSTILPRHPDSVFCYYVLPDAMR